MKKILLKIEKSKINGEGIFTDKEIKRGETFYTVSKKNVFCYPKAKCAMIDKDKWICDSNILNYVNHSCESNTRINVSKSKVSLVSIIDVKKGDEITVNYNLIEVGGINKTCRCGNKGCSGKFTVFDYSSYFKGKKITMLGLGLLGRGLNDAKFLAECGAEITVTDLKTAEQLKPTLDKLKKYKNIKYVLGEHRLENFQKTDFVLKSAGVPLDSIYIEEAKKNKIPVEMDESLFTKLAPEVTVVGITGTRGKTTTTYLIYEILKKVFGEKIHLGGNIKGLATLPLLKKVKEGDIVVMELSSWQLQGFGDAGISPQISVFTNLMNDHLNYYKGSMKRYFGDKKYIYKNQKSEDFLVIGESMNKKVGKVKSQKIVAKKNIVPIDWNLKIKGEHNLENIACAISVARIFGIEEKIIKKVVCNFAGVEGRQQFLRNYKRIKIYNDTTATTPDATIVALRALGESHSTSLDKTRDKKLGIKSKKIVLILGGADKTLDMSELVKEIPKYCKKVVLLAGTGTKKVESLKSKVKSMEVNNLKEAVKHALEGAKRGDTLLFSPAFASFGMFKNEFDRGEQFIRIIKKLK